jgi:hypothetical protein
MSESQRRRRGEPKRRTRIVPIAVLTSTVIASAAGAVPACQTEDQQTDMAVIDMRPYPLDVSAHAFDFASSDTAWPFDGASKD